MATTPLYVYHKERLRDAIVAHKFDPQKEKLGVREDQIAQELYEQLYSPSEIELMKTLPFDALPDAGSFSLRWAGQNYHRFFLKDRSLRTYARRTDTLVLDAINPLAEQADDLVRDKNTYSNARRDARTQVNNALAKYRNYEKLLADWPEIEPFVKDIQPKAIQVPAIPREALNSMLDLPPE